MLTKIDPEKVKQCRIKRDLTQDELAKISGVTQVTISQLENGHQGISFANIARIAKGLRVELREITTS